MRRLAAACAFATALLISSATLASAESQTVSGTGEITKMFASNAQTAVKAKVYGMPRPCKSRWVHVYVDWKGADSYRAGGACYPGGTWITSLEYRANEDSSKLVKCEDLVVSWNGDTKTYKMVIPRKCLTHAPNRVRLRAEGVVEGGDAQGATAGPTRLLERG